jgi:dipeptidyl aminopeptidase/acylaminoacyl peptidase
MKYRFAIAIVLWLIVICPSSILSSTQPDKQLLDKWLLLGPVTVSKDDLGPLKSEEEIFGFNFIDMENLLPNEGNKITWSRSRSLTWKRINTNSFNAQNPQLFYLATYIEPDRWLQAHFYLEKGDGKISLYLDGHSISLTPGKENFLKGTLELTHEKHLLVIKVLLPKGKKCNLNPYLKKMDGFHDSQILISTSPQHSLKPKHIINPINVSQISISPDGKQAAVNLSETSKKNGKTHRWLEILNAYSGSVIQTFKNLGGVNNFLWLNRTNAYIFTKTIDKKTSIIKFDLRNKTQTTLLENITNFSQLWCAHDDSFVIYSTRQRKDNKKDYKYIKEIEDRAQFSKNKYALFIYYLPVGYRAQRGTTHQISDFSQNYQNVVISPDNSKLLLSRSEPDNKNRPYIKTYLFLFDLRTNSTKKILENHNLNSFSWSPDSTKLLILGGPSALQGVGKNLKEGKIPNDYDTQAFIYNLTTEKAEAISKEFDPAIRRASWMASSNFIYLTATDKSFVRMFRYSIRKKIFTQLNTTIDVIQSVDFAKTKRIALYWGSGVTTPAKLYRIDLYSNSVTLVKDFNKEKFQNVKLGKYQNWNFNLNRDKTITGRIYFPVNFDKSKKYPCIVYYYGGTSPVTRDFGGRYPKNWYAANGYVVYVLQPSGAVGFGQDFSALHVNDWGKLTSEEIIAAVKEFLRVHPFVDASRVGAMGASYGGFLTQFLATKTDLFAAYISHAGISSLSSYWGVGDWGYTYSGVATANSFPWNRKDIYVGHSPLFMADRITRPILLLHGDIDNNVPPGESYQMFTALKLLGKEVALITYSNQRHWILEYKKRLHWMRTIIAWWDKHLKSQPQHWEHMYKE